MKMKFTSDPVACASYSMEKLEKDSSLLQLKNQRVETEEREKRKRGIPKGENEIEMGKD